MTFSDAAPLVAPGKPLAERVARAAIPLRPMRSDARNRIVEAAERLFRQFGYQKTTVADIARALSMSPANIYRFFDSKHAINEAVCRRLLGDLVLVATELARRDASAENRVRQLLRELARLNVERFTTDEKLHELLAVATSENWPVMSPYVEEIELILTALVDNGMQRGEFRSGDARRAGRCVQTSMMPYVHPTLVACGAAKQPTLDEMVDFCLAALRSPETRRNSDELQSQ
jgi:AcrR family transcriptional regulator